MGSQLRDLCLKGRKYVDDQVKKYSLAEKVDYQYLKTQGLFDHYNCGRYVLLKLGELLELENAPKTIEDINKILSKILSPEVAVAGKNEPDQGVALCMK